MPSLWADSLKNTNSTMDKLIVNYDDAMTEYPTGCVLSVKSTTMDAVIPGEDYLIVTKEYEAIRRIQTSDNDGYFMAYSTNTKKHPDGRLIHEPFPVPWAAVVGLYKITGLAVRKEND